VIQDGFNGHPTLFYTSAYVGEFSPRCQPPELEGVETQSMAYTEDDGSTWTKLNFGAGGNPVICQ
jgi:beta-fructofuranosidase